MRSVVWIICAVIPAFAATMAPARGEVSAASIFGNSMVLQREKPVPVWGKATPGEEVTVAFGEQIATTKAGEDGRWKVVLQPLAADATPHDLTISGSANTLEFHDVLVGEVWLCSGQSNMVWAVRNCNNAKEEIAAANFPAIRMFTVGYAPGDDQGYTIDPKLATKSYALRPQDKCLGDWAICNPKNAGAYSGLAYFCGRRLHQELKVPMGLVVSAFGATAIESWMSVEQLKGIPSYHNRAVAFDLLAKDYLADPANLPKALEDEKARFARQQAEWFTQLDAQDVGLTNKWMAPELVATDWKAIALPVSLEDNPIGVPVASIWFRKEVSIPSEWVGKDLELRLGVVDAVDETFVNGSRVGKTWFDADRYWKVSRIYTIPAADVATTTLSVVMRLLKLSYFMAPLGPAEEMRVNVKGDASGASVSLAGEWRMKKAQDLDPGLEPRVAECNKARPGGHYGQPGVMHNGMINPIRPYAIRGLLWSHGGANAPFYVDYRTLLPGLITAWRQEWGKGDFPVCVVQQSDYHQQQTRPVEREAWVNLRQSQGTALRLPHTFMPTSVGCGESNDVHYRNKQEVGRRMALAVLGEVYGRRDDVWLSPSYKSMEVEGNTIRLTFDSARGLHAEGDPPVGFSIAGADRTFYFAQARIDGEQVVAWSEKVPAPVAVRYAWASNPVCNLANEQDLPLLPFATDEWDVSQLVIGKDTITIPSGWKPK